MTELPLPVRTPEQESARALGAQVTSDLAGPGVDRGSFLDGWKRVADFGLFELLIPEVRFDGVRAVHTLEGFGEGCELGGFILGVCAHCFGVGAPLARYGNPGQLGWLARLRNGRSVGALAATEADAGSDVMSLATRYRKDGDRYLLEGQKCFVTNVQEADLFLVLATRDRRMNSRGVTAFLVPADAAGVTMGNDEPRMGLRGCSIGTLTLDGVSVATDAVVGRVGEGAAVFGHAMMWERSLVAAAQLGVLRRNLLGCVQRATDRHQFRRPIGSNQFVAGRIVDLLLRYRTSRLLVEDTAGKLTAGTLTPAEASLTKLWVSEAQIASGLDAFRIHGGSAYLRGSLAGDDLLNSLAGVVYSGTSEMQRVIIAAELGLVTL